MYYEINVSKNGKHYFATAERSIRSLAEACEVYWQLVAAFPAPEYETSVTYYELRGKRVPLDELQPPKTFVRSGPNDVRFEVQKVKGTNPEGATVIARSTRTYQSVKLADGTASLIGAVYGDTTVTGDGTLQHPLTAVLTPAQRVADELLGIVQTLSIAADEGDDKAQGTHYVDTNGRIRCKGSFLALIEEARAAIANTTGVSA